MTARPEGWPPAGEPDVQPLPPGPPPIFCDWLHYRDATCPCAYCSRRAATSPPADLRTVRLADWLPIGMIGADHALVPRALIYVAEAHRIGARSVSSLVPAERRRLAFLAATFARLATGED